MQFEIPTERPSIIKVIGVGGGGSNAVNHMFKLGIKGVDFIICNTDNQALEKSPVPVKIQLGPGLTQGLGAGAMPEVGRKAALENIDEIKEILRHGTRMVFITAGMGGGTGTGAAPIIASIAREMGILTVGIVTIPFGFEGKKRKAQADAGVEEMRNNVDTLLVICNDKLREIHGDLKLRQAFGHADDILAVAAKSIAEIITTTLHINVDFADIQTVMKGSGVAIMGSAYAEGENRAVAAVEKALHSPLLNDNSIEGARYILLNITSGDSEITMDEMTEITDHIQVKAGHTAEVIMGVGVDEALGEKINVTVIATGFKTRDQLDSVISTVEPVTKYDISGELISTSVPTSVDTHIIAEPVASAPVFNVSEKPVSHDEMVVHNLFEEEKSIDKEILEPTPLATAVSADQEIVPEIDMSEYEMELLSIDDSETEMELPSDEDSQIEVESISNVDSVIQMELPTTLDESPIVHSLEMTFDVSDESETVEISEQTDIEMAMGDIQELSNLIESENPETSQSNNPPVIFELRNDQIEESNPFVYISSQEIETTDQTEDFGSTTADDENSSEVSEMDARKQAFDRIARIRELNMRYNTPGGLSDMEREPAYKRRGVQFESNNPSSNVEISRLSLTGEPDGRPEIKPNNPFLHDRVD